jgi:hypothetical protein
MEGDKVKIEDGAERYSRQGGEWVVTAGDKPLRREFGGRPGNWAPVLRADGIIVQLDLDPQVWMISPRTLKQIEESANPHWDVAANGEVMGVTIGKTVPIVRLNIAGLADVIRKRDAGNSRAGVRDVVYLSESAKTEYGIPVGLIEQINFTVDPNTERPEDTFEVYNLSLSGDYSISSIVEKTRQEDGTLDKAKMADFLKAVKARQKGLQDDFNLIKGIYYKGQTGTTWRSFTQRAVEINDEPVGTVQTRVTQLVTVEPPPGDKQAASLTAQVTAIQNPPIDMTWTADINAVRAKWAEYRFTQTEELSLRRPQQAGTLAVEITGGSPVNIAINWNEGAARKARVVPFLPDRAPADPSRDPTCGLLRDYYGILPGNELFSTTGTRPEDWDAYLNANRARKAELLHLARLIESAERQGDVPPPTNPAVSSINDGAPQGVTPAASGLASNAVAYV